MLPTKAEKEEFVVNMFGRIAGKYDQLNDMMTLFLHKFWKKQTVNCCTLKTRDAVVLDLCTGTGDMAFIWAKNPNVKKVIAADTCNEMLEVGQQKLNTKYKKFTSKIEFINGDALKLPFNDNFFDAVTVGFGLRNVNDLTKALEEIKRVLKPGGIIASLDMGHSAIPIVDKVHKQIFLKMIPQLGASCAKDKSAYQYLIESLETWPSQRSLSQMFWDLNYSRSYFKDVALGTVAIVVAEK